MPYCHKCGSEVNESMAFCSQCGTPIKAAAPRPPMPPEYHKNEKSEKNEKQEKQEKEEKMEKGEQHEKYEKHEYSILAPLVGGVILILFGFLSYLAVSGFIDVSSIWPFILIAIGVIVILGVAAGAVMARGKNPRP
jgi:F0F1-type ATP synthase assembly protein I